MTAPPDAAEPDAVHHTFPAPGTYRVQASVTDNLGKTYRWAQTVTIDPPLTAAVDQHIEDGKVS